MVFRWLPLLAFLILAGPAAVPAARTLPSGPPVRPVPVWSQAVPYGVESRLSLAAGRAGHMHGVVETLTRGVDVQVLTLRADGTTTAHRAPHQQVPEDLGPTRLHGAGAEGLVLLTPRPGPTVLHFFLPGVREVRADLLLQVHGPDGGFRFQAVLHTALHDEAVAVLGFAGGGLALYDNHVDALGLAWRGPEGTADWDRVIPRARTGALAALGPDRFVTVTQDRRADGDAWDLVARGWSAAGEVLWRSVLIAGVGPGVGTVRLAARPDGLALLWTGAGASGMPTLLDVSATGAVNASTSLPQGCDSLSMGPDGRPAVLCRQADRLFLIRKDTDGDLSGHAVAPVSCGTAPVRVDHVDLAIADDGRTWIGGRSSGTDQRSCLWIAVLPEGRAAY